jgi:hypothetical protein
LQAALFSHFLCIFDHQGNPSLAEKKGEKIWSPAQKDSYPAFVDSIVKMNNKVRHLHQNSLKQRRLSLAISTITNQEINKL